MYKNKYIIAFVMMNMLDCNKEDLVSCGSLAASK